MRRGAVVLIALAGIQARASAQQQMATGRTLTLEEAVRLAREASEQMTIARADVQRATGEQYRARSEYFPQLNGALTYTRTLKSEFSVLQSSDSTQSSEACADFNPNRLLPLAERVDSIEAALRCRDSENPFGNLFSNLPFGRENQYNIGLSLSQNVFAGGRISAGARAASAGRRSAEIGLTSTSAQLVLDVTESYYNALLSDQLLAIAEATMAQAETTYVQVRLARQVGDQPEFELLRAQVTRDNQRPVVIQRRADRELAHMRLKQLLNLPLESELRLTSPLVNPAVNVVTVSAMESDTTVSQRAPVRQAAEAVRAQEAAFTIAKAQRLPSVSVSSQYGRVAYPSSGFPVWNQFRSNWTVSASVNVPIFTGGRLHGDQLIAEANVTAARARLQDVRERAALDTRDAYQRLRAAEASWQASAGTVEQASRANTIAEVRFREGISTQLELNDARIMLQQAQANRAVAARDLQVARARVTLLPDLPLGTVPALQSPTQGVGVNGSTTQQPQAPPRAQPTQTSRPGMPVQASRVGN
jgi:outer membrane protein TolC